MLYHAYEMQRSWMNSVSSWASINASLISNPANPFAKMGVMPMAANALDVLAHATADYGKPAFGITEVDIDGQLYPVIEATVVNRPFGDLKRFRLDGVDDTRPKLLIAAPMSGHYATLLRGTVERMLQQYEVYITDWADAATVPVHEGSFDLDDYIDYLMEFLEYIEGVNPGQRPHMMAVCQPSVPAFAATALLNQHKSPAAPATLTMMGGPIDTRESPTTVNDHAMNRPIQWFRQNVITSVPMKYRGAGRKVYPGFMQLSAFISMNLQSHMMSHYEMFKHLTAGDDASAQATKDFYDEYRAVCDMTAEFYLQTVEEVFQKHSIPNGTFEHKGEVVDLTQITNTALLAIEGERDDISGLGQTKAALKLATGLKDDKKRYYMAEGAGHYGIFNGSRWRDKVAPVVEEFVAAHG
ncbi:polyhydroxyalkanoate depolymerase [Parerythrobacter jejuensis]|uniref:Polyhydroxyalkanoate depolymerase n=1 Tax=Parerythrobacter jejuensis TaxID=795812 RepID=A0A845AWG9_9SPHN|nr:polyhydroxyalkanoate depolymerase [Parerythrobacter jejuensis]MXP31129.1 polyhydroxyalkanoate depolymerase [Parerythrobacter jejuensis]MXP33889.1 polyhydroxyalkanoate depolymerase [Parerythrobacter jejuensis]